MNEPQQRFEEELEKLKKIYKSLDYSNQKKLEEVILLIKTRFTQKMRA